MKRKTGIVLSLVAVVWMLLAYLPAPTFTLWMLHLGLLETSLVGSLLAVASLALIRPWKQARLLTALTAASFVAGVLPLALALPLYAQQDLWFSPLQYVSGAPSPDVTVARDLRLEPSQPDLTTDFYRAAGPGPHPFAVVIHGGSWRHGDKGENAGVSRALAAEGISVFDVRYRLAPAHRFPAAVADVKCLLGRIRERAQEFAVDPTRAALIGRSAGGHIAALIAYSDGDPRLPPSCAVADARVQAVAAIYGVFDLRWGYEHPIRPDVVDGPESLRQFLGGPPSDIYDLATPMNWLSPPRVAPATLLVHGASDRLVAPRHSQVLFAELQKHHVPVELLLIPLADHGFDHRPGGIGEQLTRNVLNRFLQEHL